MLRGESNCGLPFLIIKILNKMESIFKKFTGGHTNGVSLSIYLYNINIYSY